MSDERSLDDLRPALLAWSEEATNAVNADPAAFIATSSRDQWQLGDDRYYRRELTNEHVWQSSATNKLEQLPSYAALRAAAASSSLIGPMLDQMVGTAIGLSSFRLFGFASSVIPTPDEFATDESSSFDARYEKLVAQFTSAEAEYRVLYYFQGFSLSQDRLELEPGLVIERLSPDEVKYALDAGIIVSMFGSVPIFELQEGAAFALKQTWRLPKKVGGDISPAEREATTELVNPVEKAAELLQCLALLSSDSIYILGNMTRRIDNDFTMFASARTFRSLPAPRVFAGEGFKLDDAKAAELQQLWKLTHNEVFPQSKALALAVRRLSFAGQRDRVEDRLIDVFIAAEAFYLTDAAGDAKDRGELSYRLALRAAVWSQGTVVDWTQRQVFDQMKRGYNMRSVVAHGGTPKAKDIKVKGEQVELWQLVHSTEVILRAALYKALKQMSGQAGRLSIEWDNLILPEDDPIDS